MEISEGATPAQNRRYHLWLWLHPAYASEAVEGIRNQLASSAAAAVQLRVLSCEQLSLFQLRGAGSNAVLHQTLCLAKPNDLWDRLLRPLSSTSCLPSGAQLELLINPPMDK